MVLANKKKKNEREEHESQTRKNALFHKDKKKYARSYIEQDIGAGSNAEGKMGKGRTGGREGERVLREKKGHAYKLAFKGAQESPDPERGRGRREKQCRAKEPRNQ